MGQRESPYSSSTPDYQSPESPRREPATPPSFSPNEITTRFRPQWLTRPHLHPHPLASPAREVASPTRSSTTRRKSSRRTMARQRALPLMQPFVSKLPQYIALYGSVTAGMFTFTYLPQLA